MSLYKGLQNLYISKIFFSISSLISASLIFRYFGPEKRGEIAIIIAIIGIFQLLVIELGIGVQRFSSKEWLNNRYLKSLSFLWTSFITKTIIALILVVSLFLFSSTIGSFYDIDNINYILKICSICIVSFSFRGPIDSAFLTAIKEYKCVRNIEIIEALSFLSISVVTILLNKGVEFYIFFLLFSKSFIFPYTIFLYKQLISDKINPKNKIDYFNLAYMKKIVSYCFPLWLSNLMYSISPHVTLIVLSFFFNETLIGYYALSSGLYLMVYSFLSMPDGLLLPKIIEKSIDTINQKKDMILYCFNFWEIYLFISILLSFIIIGFSDFIVLLIAGSEYSESSDLLKLFSIVIFCRNLSIFRNILYLSKETKSMPKLYSARMLVEYLSYIFTINYFGIYGIPISMALGYLSYSFGLLYYISYKSQYANFFIDYKNKIFIKMFLLLIGLTFTISILIFEPSFSDYIFLFFFATLIIIYEYRYNKIYTKIISIGSS